MSHSRVREMLLDSPPGVVGSGWIEESLDLPENPHDPNQNKRLENKVDRDKFLKITRNIGKC